MLQYPIRSGKEAEVEWFVEETDTLRRVRPEASEATRAKLIGGTHRWVMRDLRRDHRGGRPEWLPRVLARFDEAGMDAWPDDVWEAFALQALWHICLDGVRGTPQSAVAPLPPIRHRDLLLAVASVDIDPLVNDVLTRFCASFLDQGVAHWRMPGREEGFFRAFAELYRRHGGSPGRWLHGLAAELDRILKPA